MTGTTDGSAGGRPIPLPSQVRRGPVVEAENLRAHPDGPSASERFGRIDAEGNIFVTLPDGNEQFVGQWTAGDPAAGLRLYAHRYDDLIVDVDLAGRRLGEGRMSPQDAERTVERVRAALLDPKCVGDLAALADHVKQLEVLIGARREVLAEERAAVKAEAMARRTAIVEEAEKLATGRDWRRTPERFRAMVEEWKTIPRTDRAAEQELWQRLSKARSSFDKTRRSEQAAQEKEYAKAKAAKEKLIAEAEALSTSTEWNDTARELRALMDRWKAAGFAGKREDAALWKRFRAAQDVFFNARSAVFDERDKEQKANLAARRAVVAQAEELLPVTDAAKARKRLRTLQSEYLRIGHVPRADKPKLDARMQKVDDAIKAVEQEQWRRSDPERNERAQVMVTLYERAVAAAEADLDAARAAGADTSAAEKALADQQALLEAARKYA